MDHLNAASASYKYIHTAALGAFAVLYLCILSYRFTLSLGGGRMLPSFAPFEHKHVVAPACMTLLFDFLHGMAYCCRLLPRNYAQYPSYVHELARGCPFTELTDAMQCV